MKLTNTLVVFAAASLLGGCAQFTGTDDVSFDGDPITKPGKPGKPGQPGTPDVGSPPTTSHLTCAYPSGVTYGPDMGQTIAPTTGVNWNGYAAGEAQPGNFPITNLYDCFGEEVHAIVLDTSQFG